MSFHDGVVVGIMEQEYHQPSTTHPTMQDMNAPQLMPLPVRFQQDQTKA
jgi:hypothetical protein